MPRRSSGRQRLVGPDGMDLDKLEARNRQRVRIAYASCGKPSDPCVLVPPGGGATKENSLFWARELAATGGFFVVMYDLRDTGRSFKSGLGTTFDSFGTSAEQELSRVTGKSATLKELKERKATPGALNAELMEQLYDYEAYALDGIYVLDELGVDRAHVMGLSNGAMVGQVIATLFPDRVLTCVSAGTSFDGSGVELAMLSPGAEDFYDQVKAAGLYDEDGKAPWTCESVEKAEYVEWKATFLNIIAPGFPAELWDEIAEREFETGIVTPEECCVCGLAWELFNRTGKLQRHHELLRENSVPMMLVHGRNDPVIHFSEVERLFRVTKNCVLEAHSFGHNFGPPAEQKKILARVTTFMKRNARGLPAAGRGAPAPQITGSDAFDAGLSVDPGSLAASSAAQLYELFCAAQSAADTHAVFRALLEKMGLEGLQGRGLRLFMALKAELGKAGLNYKQGKLLRDLHGTLLKAQKAVGRVRHSKPPAADRVLEETIVRFKEHGQFNKALVCGAGPVGLRTACELQLLGFDVLVVEKRPNFSRANILTFWDETMADMLGLGAKSYFPELRPSGINKHLGTRQMQTCLLKTLLLLGGRAEYGMEVCGLQPPAPPGAPRWRACFRPYVKHRRAKETTAELAVEFQKAKDYAAENGEQEVNEVDMSFVDATAGEDAEAIEFDAYVIAEGGWSDSTRKLGFSKAVEHYKSIFGLVVNAQYDPSDMKQRNMQSQIHFALSGNWPLSRCPIQAEFIEYLKGETHFLALVVPKKNHHTDQTDAYLDRVEKETGERPDLPQSVLDMLRLSATQKGLLEMGVFREDRGSGRQCLAPDNVDVPRLHEMARTVMAELGLSEDVALYPSNPVQLFDFSRRARCLDPVRVLCGPGSVRGPAEFQEGKSKEGGMAKALALPVGDALQEPNWTQGLGINRGFHTGMNQAYACLLARERSLDAAVRESVAVHRAMLRMRWGAGHSGLAGSGSGNIGLKPFREWDADPRNRLPYT